MNLNSVINSHIENAISGIHTSFPAKIVDYDEKKQMGNFQPLIKKVFKDNSLLSMPIIHNVPIIFPSGGGGLLSFPIKEGDTMLLTCSERSIDAWLSSNGEETEPNDFHKFSLSDAIAIPGLYPFNKSPSLNLTDSDKDDVTLSFNKGKISLKDDSIEITAESKINLKCGNNTLIISKDSIEIKTDKSISIECKNAEIKADKTSFSGDIDCNGSIKCMDLTANTDVKLFGGSLSLGKHIHTAPPSPSGTPTSGPISPPVTLSGKE